MCSLLPSLTVPPGLSMHECGALGSASHYLVGSASYSLACPFHNPPPHWVHQPLPCCESYPPQLPVSAPPTGLYECFFFISLVVGLPCSSIFCQFWLFFVFKLLLSFFSLCEEAVCLPTPPSWLEADRPAFVHPGYYFHIFSFSNESIITTIPLL